MSLNARKIKNAGRHFYIKIILIKETFEKDYFAQRVTFDKKKLVEKFLRYFYFNYYYFLYFCSKSFIITTRFSCHFKFSRVVYKSFQNEAKQVCLQHKI